MPSQYVTWKKLEEGFAGRTGERHELIVERHPAYLYNLQELRFHRNSAIMLPMRRTAGTAGSQATDGFARLGKLLADADSVAGKKLLVVGHADTSATPAHDQALSERRAENVYLYLSGDREAWSQHCAASFHAQDVQDLLQWVAHTFGYPCDPGAVDNRHGKKAQRALAALRREHNARHGTNLQEQGPINQEDWGVCFDLFDAHLADRTGMSASQLDAARDKLDPMSPPTLGCGEHFVGDRPPLRDYAGAAGRRVELVFFETAKLPELKGIHPPGSEIYAWGKFKPESLDERVDSNGGASG